MKPAHKPLFEFLAATFRLADENEHNVQAVIRLAERFKRSSHASARQRLRAVARERVRRLHANAERITLHLARFEQHLPKAPIHWHSTIRTSIQMGTRRAVLARRAAVATQNIFEPPARLDGGSPATLLH